jgi:hypothetical protein
VAFLSTEFVSGIQHTQKRKSEDQIKSDTYGVRTAPSPVRAKTDNSSLVFYFLFSQLASPIKGMKQTRGDLRGKKSPFFKQRRIVTPVLPEVPNRFMKGLVEMGRRCESLWNLDYRGWWHGRTIMVVVEIGSYCNLS